MNQHHTDGSILLREYHSFLWWFQSLMWTSQLVPQPYVSIISTHPNINKREKERRGKEKIKIGKYIVYTTWELRVFASEESVLALEHTSSFCAPVLVGHRLSLLLIGHWWQVIRMGKIEKDLVPTLQSAAHMENLDGVLFHSLSSSPVPRRKIKILDFNSEAVFITSNQSRHSETKNWFFYLDSNSQRISSLFFLTTFSNMKEATEKERK